MTAHTHTWERQPLHSHRTFERFRCEACGRWGYRSLDLRAGATLRPIKAYVEGWEPSRIAIPDEDEIGRGHGPDAYEAPEPTPERPFSERRGRL